MGIRGCSGVDTALREHRRNPEGTGSSQFHSFKNKDLGYSEVSSAWPVLHSALLKTIKQISQLKERDSTALQVQENMIISNLIAGETECSSASSSVDQMGDHLKRLCSYHVRIHLTFDTKRRFKYITCQ